MGKMGVSKHNFPSLSKVFSPSVSQPSEEKGKNGESPALNAPSFAHDNRVLISTGKAQWSTPELPDSPGTTYCAFWCQLAPEESQQSNVLVRKGGIKVLLGLRFNAILQIKRLEQWLTHSRYLPRGSSRHQFLVGKLRYPTSIVPPKPSAWWMNR